MTIDDAIPAAIILMCVLAVVATIMAFWSDAAWQSECGRRGGHVLSQTRMGWGLSGTGKPIAVPQTFSLCVSSDGRILEF
ncbi:hypothetical protein [Hyphomicrobium sp. DY-1]|uniref:hypothetical protein n=1 Tax=Hyphomicrobium sp. DY-1 TaxID=3075650 RepID=UPI0039C0E783